MNILGLIAGNWAHGPQSRRYPDRPVPAPEYRGPVRLDPRACLGCGICARVCVSAAIEVTSAQEASTWTYDPAGCTFCGVCVSHCPATALSQAPDRGDVSYHRGDQVDTQVVEHPRCPRCGGPALPTADAVIAAAFGDRADDLRDRVRLCERCRTRATVQGMKKAFGATLDTDTIRSGHGR